jgi:hypothetical protein
MTVCCHSRAKSFPVNLIYEINGPLGLALTVPLQQLA